MPTIHFSARCHVVYPPLEQGQIQAACNRWTHDIPMGRLTQFIITVHLSEDGIIHDDDVWYVWNREADNCAWIVQKPNCDDHCHVLGSTYHRYTQWYDIESSIMWSK